VVFDFLFALCVSQKAPKEWASGCCWKQWSRSDWLNLKVIKRYREVAASDPSQGHSGSSSKLM